VASRIKDAGALEMGRARLLKGARKCFATKGYGGTSVQDIANAAGISIGSLYKYVRAKEDLLSLMAETSHASLREVVDVAFASVDDPIAGLHIIISALVRQADRDRDLMNLLYAEFKYLPAGPRKLILDQEISIHDRLVDLIDAANAAGLYDCPDPHLAAVNITMFGSMWVLKSHLIKLTIDEYIDRQTTLALRLVGADSSDVSGRRSAERTQG
jgi:TetR/AcrR family transcriptional regulator, cholesterol catabolism regulator